MMNQSTVPAWIPSTDDVTDGSVDVVIMVEAAGAELISITFNVANVEKVSYSVLFAEHGDVETPLTNVVSCIVNFNC